MSFPTRQITSGAAAAMLGLAFAAVPASASEDTFIIRDVAAPPDEAAAAIRAHVEADEDWLFLAEFGLAGGAVTALKICYLPLGPDIVAAGMHVMAMMPCGNMALYEEDGQTRLSMLDLGFMTTLYPDENLASAVESGRPAFAAMLDEVFD